MVERVIDVDDAGGSSPSPRTMTEKQIIVLYHGDCPDGFGAAFAAWKKFKDAAEYVALSRSDTPPLELVKNKEVYLPDFTFNRQEDIDAFI